MPPSPVRGGLLSSPPPLRGRGRNRRAAVNAALALALLVAGCQQKMAETPTIHPLEASSFFADGRGSRPLEEGVIARGQWLDDSPMLTGLSEQGKKPPKADAGPGTPLPGTPKDTADFVDTFPFPIDKKELLRGQERYTAFCTACHGTLGNGNGKVPERGFLRPPSFHTEKAQADEPDAPSGELRRGYSRGFSRWGKEVALRDVPVGYIYEVVTKGYGGMAEYASQIPPEDRWRIVAYVRALQVSRHVEVDKVPDIKKQLEGKP